ncbi:MAG: hypothetical protein LBP52_00330 [Burkholderiaceae bacterium]|nr:hypothetical protein [Burkholderiaceae bacterium]
MAAAALFLTPASYAQSVVTLYENNFENPATSDCNNGWGGSNGSTLKDDYGTPENPINQALSLDRLCASTDANDASKYYDPSQTAGQYTGGIAAGPVYFEAWSLQFDPKGHDKFDLNMDWSLIDLRTQPIFMPTNGPKDVVTRFYRVPAGSTFGLTNGGSGATIPYVTLDGSVATPFAQSNFTIHPFPATDYPAKAYTFNWQTQTLSVSLAGQGFQPGDKVAVVYHLDNAGNSVRVYAAFDNYRITAPVPPVPGNALWALILMALGVLGFGWHSQRKPLH